VTTRGGARGWVSSDSGDAAARRPTRVLATARGRTTAPVLRQRSRRQRSRAADDRTCPPPEEPPRGGRTAAGHRAAAGEGRGVFGGGVRVREASHIAAAATPLRLWRREGGYLGTVRARPPTHLPGLECAALCAVSWCAKRGPRTSSCQAPGWWASAHARTGVRAQPWNFVCFFRALGAPGALVMCAGAGLPACLPHLIRSAKLVRSERWD